jgi:hypothetical protein
MVETIRELYKKYPDGKIPFDESPTLSSQVFLDLCERVIALEQAYTVLLTERAQRIKNNN